MKKLLCLLFTILFVFSCQTATFANMTYRINDIQEESQYTFSEDKSIPESSTFNIALIASKAKKQDASTTKHHLIVFINANNGYKLTNIYSLSKNPLKLSFLKNSERKVIDFTTNPNDLYSPIQSILNLAFFLDKDLTAELAGMTELTLMLPLADGSYKSFPFPQDKVDEWNHVLTVDLSEVEKNMKNKKK